MTNRRLLLVVTGATTAAHIPYWINWIAMNHPNVQVRILRTKGAQRFVTRASLASPVVQEILDDSWDAVDDQPLHVELSQWADGVLVYPASQSYLADLAHDRGDRPSLLVAQLLKGRVVVAPGLAPGGIESGALTRSWKTLEREGIATVVAPVPGISKHDPTLTSWAPGDFAEAFAAALAESPVVQPEADTEAVSRLNDWLKGINQPPLMLAARAQLAVFLGPMTGRLHDVAEQLNDTADANLLLPVGELIEKGLAGDDVPTSSSELETFFVDLSRDSTATVSELGAAGIAVRECDRIATEGWSTERFIACVRMLAYLLSESTSEQTRSGECWTDDTNE
ncbi:flavoprotein [Rhodococcus qingshengii]|uniref:flavoprotein n=1 Tax=Rhodococcus qingshengii TaxID=334542 RepID=UPI003668E32F